MKKIIELARATAAEGMVLLKNSGHVLPLVTNDKVSVFGRCQLDYYRSGTGSGGAVNTSYNSNVIDGLQQTEQVQLNNNLLNTYQNWVKENPFDNGGGAWAAEPWFQKEMPITDDLVKSAKEASDKAIIVIGRTAGEDQDNFNTEGSYQLTEAEKNMLEKVTRYFDKTIVVLNVSNIIDMSWVDGAYNNPITSILYAWHGGMEGGNALGEILTGKITPSGKMTDTIAYRLEDYPSDKNFGDLKVNYYEEDIYVGYRYFETFKPEVVRYDFGFGMSYTDFDFRVISSKIEEHNLKKVLNVQVEVKNIGSLYSGKEVVQLYYSAPQGKLGKPHKVLGAFKKTKLLSPKEVEVIELMLPFENMASYDDGGYAGTPSAYILEAGDYKFYLGSSVKQSNHIKVNQNDVYKLNELIVVEQLKEASAPAQSFKRMKPGQCVNNVYEITYEDVPTQSIDLEKRMLENKPKTLEVKDNNSYTLADVSEYKVDMASFVAQMDVVELSTLVKGEGMCSAKVTAGTASAFGALTPALQKYGIPVAACADGPSGIRMDSGKKATQVAIGTLLACSWDTKIVEELYKEVGKELVENNIDNLLGPGLNIHRHPLNGRNFEYFSEDPLVTGLFATAVTKGLKSGGSTATLKHFVANDQEVERHTVDAVMSERALREINLKGFEMAVKEGLATSIMTSYNPVNGIYAASNYDLNTTILREEWGFKGIVMTDWWAKVNHPVKGGKGNTFNKSYMIQAQNDLYMVVPNNAAHEFTEDDLLTAVESGALSVGELQRSAMNICTFLMNSLAFKNAHINASNRLFKSNKNKQNETCHLVDEVINTLSNHKFEIKVDETSSYKVQAKMRYVSTSLAQASFNLLLNSEFVVTTQLNGSEHQWKEIEIAHVELENGYYNVELEFLRSGIEVEFITIEKI